MSGSILDGVREPVVYPEWMWVAGLILFLIIVAWIVVCLVRWWKSDANRPRGLRDLSAEQRRAYRDNLVQIEVNFSAGEWNESEVHLAVAGLMRALGTERTGRNLESATVAEIRALVPMWPAYVHLMERCVEPSFSGQPTRKWVSTLLESALKVIDQ